VTEAKRVGKFGVVGLLNTVIDFGLLNVVHFHFGVTLIVANLISTTVAMTFSFLANRRVVFTSHTKNLWQQIWRFWIVTAIGVYVFQTGAIWLFTHPFSAVPQLGVTILHDIGLHSLSSSFIIANLAKLLGTVISLVWNYIMYREVVFI
jgi:putative flippase GtrA